MQVTVVLGIIFLAFLVVVYTQSDDCLTFDNGAAIMTYNSSGKQVAFDQCINSTDCMLTMCRMAETNRAVFFTLELFTPELFGKDRLKIVKMSIFEKNKDVGFFYLYIVSFILTLVFFLSTTGYRDNY